MSIQTKIHEFFNKAKKCKVFSTPGPDNPVVEFTTSEDESSDEYVQTVDEEKEKKSAQQQIEVKPREHSPPALASGGERDLSVCDESRPDAFEHSNTDAANPAYSPHTPIGPKPLTPLPAPPLPASPSDTK
jgi:hypothetical protein